MRLIHPEVRDLEDEDLFDLYDEPGPYLRAGFVASVDGAIAVGGQSRPLQSPADNAVFRALRTVADAVIVGAGTARAEEYGPVRLRAEGLEWRQRHGRADVVPLVVVTRSGDVPAKATSGPHLVTGRDLPTDPADLVAALHERGLTRLLCEGGPSLLTDLLRLGLVDELCLTTSPQLVGPAPHLVAELPAPVQLHLESLVHDDPGVLLGRWSVVPSRP